MRGTHGKCGERAYNGGLRRCPSGVQGQKPWSGGFTPEAESFSALEYPKEAAFYPFLGVLETLQWQLSLNWLIVHP